MADTDVAAAPAAAASSEGETVVLRSIDGKEYRVSRRVAESSLTIRNIVQDVEDLSAPLEMPTITGAVLRKALDYMEHHVADADAKARADGKSADDVDQWDADYVEVRAPRRTRRARARAMHAHVPAHARAPQRSLT